MSLYWNRKNFQRMRNHWKNFWRTEVQPITVLYASDGVGENYPIDFFDVAYDADTGIAYFSELTPKEQAEMLVEKAEFPRTIFTEEEKAFVTEYAETFPWTGRKTE